MQVKKTFPIGLATLTGAVKNPKKLKFAGLSYGIAVVCLDNNIVFEQNLEEHLRKPLEDENRKHDSYSEEALIKEIFAVAVYKTSFQRKQKISRLRQPSRF